MGEDAVSARPRSEGAYTRLVILPSWLLLACSAAPVPVPATSDEDPLAPIAGHWRLTWTRPGHWWPKEFTGPLVVRQIDDTWAASLAFEQTAGRFELSAIGVTDAGPQLTFAAGDSTFELVVDRSADRLTGQARWPGSIDWSPVVAEPVSPVPAALTGPALRPLLSPPLVDPGLLLPSDAYDLPRPPYAVLSGDGLRIWLSDGHLWTGDVDALDHLTTVGDSPNRADWMDSDPAGNTLFVAYGGAIRRTARDGTRSVLTRDLGDVRWVVPRWADGKLWVAAASGDGVKVLEVSLDSGDAVEVFTDPTADDVVLDPAGKPRLLIDRVPKHFGTGVEADLITVRTPEGSALGPVIRQPRWVESTRPVPQVGEGPVHLLGGGDLATLGEIGRKGFRPDPSAGQWADAVTLTFDPETHAVDAIGWQAERLHWEARTPDGEELGWLQDHLSADVRVVQRAGGDRRWIVSASSGSRPFTLWLFDRDARTVTELRAPGAEPARVWHPVDAVVIEARDGDRIPAYVTRPDGSGPWPLVVEVHGGPWSGRHGWQFDDRAQQWAERGYATLAVDFRGTHGFGWSRMESAGFGDDPMVHDVEDGIRWAIENGIADPARIAMVGESYGGHAALRFATAETPTLKCAVGGLVRGNLTVPGGGLNILAVKNASWREAHSPDRFTARITGPVLVWNGGRDGENADTIRDFVSRGEAAGKPVTWVRFPWEEHGLRDRANQAALAVIVDRFLGACLGGPSWEFPPEFGQAELEVRAGAAGVPGLADHVR